MNGASHIDKPQKMTPYRHIYTHICIYTYTNCANLGSRPNDMLKI